MTSLLMEKIENYILALERLTYFQLFCLVLLAQCHEIVRYGEFFAKRLRETIKMNASLLQFGDQLYVTMSSESSLKFEI